MLFHPESVALEVLYVLLTLYQALYQDKYVGLSLELSFPLPQLGLLNVGAILNWQHFALPADSCARAGQLVLTP